MYAVLKKALLPYVHLQVHFIIQMPYLECLTCTTLGLTATQMTHGHYKPPESIQVLPHLLIEHQCSSHSI